MRLINAQTLELEEFYDTQIPKYAIVSHRWRAEEVSFDAYCRLLSDSADSLHSMSLSVTPQELNDPASHRYIKRSGLRKIVSACVQAVADGLGHVWIDTCGIDKSSSAELQEAINSMYAWYKRSSVCYVFLDDVEDFGDDSSEQELEKFLSYSEW